jgi:hypothetical protein
MIFSRSRPLFLAPGEAIGVGPAGLAKAERSAGVFALDTRKADLFVQRGVGQ